MNFYIFNLDWGWLPDGANQIAKRHGAMLNNTVLEGCHCDYHCEPFKCPMSRQHYFSAPHLGMPYDRYMQDNVMTDLIKEGLVL